METTIVISKEKYIALKNELKSLAKEIKSSKHQYKEQQSEISKKNICYCWGKPNGEWQNLWNLESKRKELKFQARHKLIIYALMKGRSYEQIERKVRENNSLDWAYIRRLQDELAS